MGAGLMWYSGGEEDAPVREPRVERRASIRASIKQPRKAGEIRIS